MMKQIFLTLVFTASLSVLSAQEIEKDKQVQKEEQSARVRASKEALQSARASGDRQAVREAKERLRTERHDLHELNREIRDNNSEHDRKRDRDRKQERDKHHGQSILNKE